MIIIVGSWHLSLFSILYKSPYKKDYSSLSRSPFSSLIHLSRTENRTSACTNAARSFTKKKPPQIICPTCPTVLPDPTLPTTRKFPPPLPSKTPNPNLGLPLNPPLLPFSPVNPLPLTNLVTRSTLLLGSLKTSSPNNGLCPT